MVNTMVDTRTAPLTGIQKLELIEAIKRREDRQRRVDAIVLATQICMKESQQAKVDAIVLAMQICKKESAQTRVDKLVMYAKLASLA